MRIQFLGTGDAFGSGARFNTSFHVASSDTNFLIDCGATSLVAMNRFGVDRNSINMILLTHFHLDHFGGVPFFILEAQTVGRRKMPLLLAGPPGLPEWYARLTAASFPGDRELPFSLTFCEVEIGRTNKIGALDVIPFAMRHDDLAGPCLGYRIQLEDKIIAFSGDTKWTETLLQVGRGADLFICESFSFAKPVGPHLAFKELEPHLPIIGAKRVILTHMGDDMLQRRADIACETVNDGDIIEL
jgi:ribonuclease BN (tRNA processing enzyme)